MMADDVNAAIRGARRGGATEIVVNDSHGSMRNLRLEDLPTMTRPAPDTIAFTSDSMAEAYTLIRLLYRYINPD
jgi:D-aminopeptidase